MSYLRDRIIIKKINEAGIIDNESYDYIVNEIRRYYNNQEYPYSEATRQEYEQKRKPEDVQNCNNLFGKIIKPNLSADDFIKAAYDPLTTEIRSMKESINKIRGWVTFLGVITCIGLALSIIAGIFACASESMV